MKSVVKGRSDAIRRKTVIKATKAADVPRPKEVCKGKPAMKTKTSSEEELAKTKRISQRRRNAKRRGTRKDETSRRKRKKGSRMDEWQTSAANRREKLDKLVASLSDGKFSAHHVRDDFVELQANFDAQLRLLGVAKDLELKVAIAACHDMFDVALEKEYQKGREEGLTIGRKEGFVEVARSCCQDDRHNDKLWKAVAAKLQVPNW